MEIARKKGLISMYRSTLVSGFVTMVGLLQQIKLLGRLFKKLTFLRLTFLLYYLSVSRLLIYGKAEK